MGSSAARQALLRVLRAVFVAVMMLSAVVTVAEGERFNKSSSKGAESGSGSSAAAAVVNDHDELDGGFSSLDGMLHWAIGHSDTDKLKETAKSVQSLSPDELEKRQMEIKELTDKLKMPSDAQLMQIAIDDLNNSSLPLEDHHRALQELLILVEPIDNANDLNKLGGLGVLMEELNHPDSDIRRVSAWILGKACQNNAVVQKQVLELGGVQKLIKMVYSTSPEEAIKAFFALSSLIRNNLAGQRLFYEEAGDQMLQNILINSSTDIRLQRKAISLIADLAEYQLEDVERTDHFFFSNPVLLKSIVDLTATTDIDLQEKALVAIKSLLELKTTEASIFEDLGGALERMRLQLQDLMSVEYHRDYAIDMEILRREVEVIFHRKHDKVIRVPT
ncbi:hsp70 nucleotide exchange factor FES1 [Euphorbia lathyris]|uniref:hsp70 nucleotide exchange factor FES1 n=1 Tax=Euphorbia lathyris TaxID=212925 RepID=UPI0033140833